MRRLVAAQASMMAIPVLGFPAMSVPTGVAGALPTGVQLLGRRFDEDTRSKPPRSSRPEQASSPPSTRAEQTSGS
ncbi:hypothetical protein [Geodermatophilus siccatus]|uniref:hypothetical protein n=1 Tax=Geodermatophilus siccatus TaxID=1137991 RepID=UPI0011139C04|nr:hypothetical protein [Geodermatophilus siccatus]